MRARIALALLMVVPAAAFVSRPASAGPWGLGQKEWVASIEGSTFTANTFNGATTRGDTGLVVEERALRSTIEVGWKKHMTLVFGLPVASVTRRDASVQGTATGFQDVQAGLRYHLVNGRSAAAVELDWTAPAGYNRHLAVLGIRLGDGLQELSAQLALGSAIGSRGFVQGSAGYGRRFLGIAKRTTAAFVPGDPRTAQYLWSDHLHLSGDVAWWITQHWLAAGRYRGDLTLSHGALALDSDAHLAGPALYYRVDDRLDMFAGSWSTAKGKNVLHFDQVYLGFAFHRDKLNRLQGFLGGTAP